MKDEEATRTRRDTGTGNNEERNFIAENPRRFRLSASPRPTLCSSLILHPSSFKSVPYRFDGPIRQARGHNLSARRSQSLV